MPLSQTEDTQQWSQRPHLLLEPGFSPSEPWFHNVTLGHLAMSAGVFGGHSGKRGAPGIGIGGGQGCCQAPYRAQGSPTKKN